MLDANPYESPKSAEPISARDLGQPRQGSLVWIVIPTLLGAVVGSMFLAPYCRGPGDPWGHSIGSGLGGFAGLFSGILIRAVRWAARAP